MAEWLSEGWGRVWWEKIRKVFGIFKTKIVDEKE